MRILHMMLAAFYIDGFSYQENMLPRQNRIDGHEVMIIASTFSFDKSGKGCYLAPSRYINEDGIPVVRLPYRKIFPRWLCSKINAYPSVYSLVEQFKPDIVFFHGLNSSELRTAARYKKRHPGVKLYADTHADYYTSGTNLVSLRLLHGFYNRLRIRRSLPYIDKVFYISVTCGEFLHEIYGVPAAESEFMSLGGTIEPLEKRERDRREIRSALGIDNDDIMLVHAGKLDEKKKTVELLEAFKQCTNPHVKLYIIGSVSESIRAAVEALVQELPNAAYLGWKDSAELTRYLHACDIYVQPGKVSAIAQMALCCGAAVILNNLPDYRPFVDGNGWLIDSPSKIVLILNTLKRQQATVMMRQSILIAKNQLDYENVCKRLYSISD